jgi:DNA-binding NarL/FixJ family response regulator
MFGRWITRRSRPPEILAVSRNMALLVRIQETFGDDVSVRCVSDVEEALTVLASRPVFGAVIDGALPGQAARMLARAFLRHQPVGRVAIVAADDDASTLIGLAHCDPRVEMLYRPLDDAALIGCVLAESVAVGV